MRGILIPLSGMEPMHPTEEAWSLNHWRAGEDLKELFLSAPVQTEAMMGIWYWIKDNSTPVRVYTVDTITSLTKLVAYWLAQP